MFRITQLTLLASLLLALAVPARAGVVDSPLPAPFTQHVFTVPGLVYVAGLQAYCSCTNLNNASVTIGVELFGYNGGVSNDAAATSLNVAPGATVLFGTGAAVNMAIDSNFFSLVSTSSARILATSKKIACTAFLADPANAPPTSLTYLTIIAKPKQKAAN